MSDRYQDFASSALGTMLVKNLGLPNPVKLDRYVAGSPLVVGDLVIVAASGRLVAYDAASGERRWLGPEGGGGYSSPQLATIGGVPQVLLLRGSRSTSVAPADGSLLWEHKGEPGVSIVQPALTADGDVLVAAGDSMGGCSYFSRLRENAPSSGGRPDIARSSSRQLTSGFDQPISNAP